MWVNLINFSIILHILLDVIICVTSGRCRTARPRIAPVRSQDAISPTAGAAGAPTSRLCAWKCKIGIRMDGGVRKRQRRGGPRRHCRRQCKNYYVRQKRRQRRRWRAIIQTIRKTGRGPQGIYRGTCPCGRTDGPGRYTGNGCTARMERTSVGGSRMTRFGRPAG